MASEQRDKAAREEVRQLHRYLTNEEPAPPLVASELYRLTEIFRGPFSGETLIYDDFRRKFEISAEYVALVKQAYEGIDNTEVVSLETGRTLLRRCKALATILGDLIWLIHCELKLRPVVIISEKASTDHYDSDIASDENCVQVKISQARIQKSNLTLESGIDSPYLHVTPDAYWGWTTEPTEDEYENSLWKNPESKSDSESHPQYPSDKFRLTSYVGFRVFYEDDRAQIVAVYGKASRKADAGNELACIYINGQAPTDGGDGDFKNGSWFRQFSITPSLGNSSERSDENFAAFVAEAVFPYQTKFKVGFLNRDFVANGKKFAIAKSPPCSRRASPDAAISIAFAVPVEPLDTDDGQKRAGIDAVFGFLTAELYGPHELFTDTTLEALSEYIWDRVSYFQEPMLRLLATERSEQLKAQRLKLREQSLELKRIKFVFDLIQEPVDHIAKVLTSTQAMVNRLHGIFRYPYRGLFVRAHQMHPFFHSGSLTLFGVVIHITHNASTLSGENEKWNSTLKDGQALRYLLLAIIRAFMGDRYDEPVHLPFSFVHALTLLDGPRADQEVNLLLKGILQKDLRTRKPRVLNTSNTLMCPKGEPAFLSRVYSDLKYVFLRAFKPLDPVRGIPLGMLHNAMPLLKICNWTTTSSPFGEDGAPEPEDGEWLVPHSRVLPFASVSDFLEILCKIICLNGADGRGEGTRIEQLESGFKLCREPNNPKPFLKIEHSGSLAQWIIGLEGDGWHKWLIDYRPAARGDFADVIYHLLERANFTESIDLIFCDPVVSGVSLTFLWRKKTAPKNLAFQLKIAEQTVEVEIGGRT